MVKRDTRSTIEIGYLSEKRLDLVCDFWVSALFGSLCVCETDREAGMCV